MRFIPSYSSPPLGLTTIKIAIKKVILVYLSSCVVGFVKKEEEEERKRKKKKEVGEENTYGECVDTSHIFSSIHQKGKKYNYRYLQVYPNIVQRHMYPYKYNLIYPCNTVLSLKLVCRYYAYQACQQCD